MYAADHFLLSTTYAVVCSKRYRLPFVPLAFLLILINGIDIDHLIYGYLDDGTANSLTLHPLHIYAGAIIFLAALYSLYKPLKSQMCLALIGGFSLHLFADSMAYAVKYNVHVLMLLDLIWLPLFLFLANKFLISGPKKTFQAFIVIYFLFCGIEQGILSFILKLKAQVHPWILYGNGAVLPMVGALMLYLFFKNKSLET